MDLEDRVLEIINTGINKDGFLDIDKDTILNDGLIDSLDIMRFINDLEHTFNVHIYGKNTGFTKDDFKDIHAISAFIQKKANDQDFIIK